MKFNKIVSRGQKRIQTVTFLGLNNGSKIREGEFSDMTNLCSRLFPVISSRPSRMTTITMADKIQHAFTPGSGSQYDFCGISENRFFYNGRRFVQNIWDADSQTTVDIGGRILIFPSAWYYDYGKYENNETQNTSLMEMSVSKQYSIDFISSVDSNENITNQMYLRTVNGRWSDDFQVGDSVLISGVGKNSVVEIEKIGTTATEDSIVSCIVEKIEDMTMTVLLYNMHGRQVAFENDSYSSVSISRNIPPIYYACGLNNRVWGTDYEGRFIYASKLGSHLNFNCFSGLSTDSYWVDVGSVGRFTGICSYENHILAFKEDAIYEVFGDRPSNYTVSKVCEVGPVCNKAVTVLNGVLYFLGRNGLYRFTGGVPQKLSHNITMDCDGCVLGNDGEKVFVYAGKEFSGTVFVYDPRYRLFHKEDQLPINSFYTLDGELFAAADNKVYSFKFKSGPQEDFEWQATFDVFTGNVMDNISLTELYIRMMCMSPVDVYVSYNQTSYNKVNTVACYSTNSIRIPVRAKKADRITIKLVGRGLMTLRDFEKTYYVGGRNIRT